MGPNSLYIIYAAGAIVAGLAAFIGYNIVKKPKVS